jgi:hypothetical protein
LSVRRQAARRPGAEERAAGVVNVDLLVGVHDPDRVAGGVAGGVTGSGVAIAQDGVAQGGPGEAVAVRAVGAGVIDHVKLGRVVVCNRAHALGTNDGSSHRISATYK